MTRLTEALKWWKKQTYNELWYHEIPKRHFRVLRKAEMLEKESLYQYKLKKDVD